MKFATLSKTLVLTLTLLLASSAFAAGKNTLTLSDAATVNGTTLKAGDYTVQWDGTGPDVDVTISQGKKVIAKTQAKLVDLNSPATNNAAVVKQNGDGSRTLAGARFEGKKVAIDLAPSADGMQGGSSK